MIPVRLAALSTALLEHGTRRARSTWGDPRVPSAACPYLGLARDPFLPRVRTSRRQVALPAAPQRSDSPPVLTAKYREAGEKTAESLDCQQLRPVLICPRRRIDTSAQAGLDSLAAETSCTTPGQPRFGGQRDHGRSRHSDRLRGSGWCYFASANRCPASVRVQSDAGANRTSSGGSRGQP
jgi:hypothetical protein